MELKGALGLPSSQDSAAGPRPEPDKYSAHLHILAVLLSHLRLDLSRGFFASGFPTIIFYAFIISVMHATCPSYHPLFDHRNIR